MGSWLRFWHIASSKRLSCMLPSWLHSIAALFCSIVLGESGTLGSHTAEFQRLRENFRDAVRLVLRMMTSLHRQGMHTHLAQLLLRLDYNGYFSGEIDE